MKRIIPIALALLMLLSGCGSAETAEPAMPESNAATADIFLPQTGPGPTNPIILPADGNYTEAAFAVDDGSGALTVRGDVNSDGIEESFIALTEYTPSGEYYEYDGQTHEIMYEYGFLSAAVDGSVVSEVKLAGAYPAALLLADLIPGDGITEIVVSYDFASCDFCTEVYRFDGSTLQLLSTIDGCVYQAEGGVICTYSYGHPFGSWLVLDRYVWSDAGNTLARSGDRGILASPPGEDGATEDIFASENSYRCPTLVAPLEVYTGSGAVTLPAGTRLVPTGCDYTESGRNYVCMRSDSGLDCWIYVQYNVELDSGFQQVAIVDADGALHGETEYFDGLFYAG